ncbi:MAG: EamA family transporter [Deltaproteobacteria bacterium]|jgi:RarD protein|nr:EamA family transporter [Deltaproteobacteria bacterium]
MPRAPRQVYVFLVIGLIAASQSGNIIRFGDAHPVAIAAWRLLLASALLAPLAGARLRQLATLSTREVLLLLASGMSLALHFFAWIAAVQWTTVANAAVFFAINPVITAGLGFLFFRERVSRMLAVSIGLGLGGVAVMGIGDLRLDPGSLPGDAAALVCSLLFTAYFLLGKRLRQSLHTSVYVTGIYGVAAAFSFAVLLVLDLPIIDYDGRTWLCFVLMALVPTMIGHTSFNNAVRYIDAGRISTATLSEPLLAGLVAYLAWGETITWTVGVGYALISASVIVLIMDREAR